MAKRRTGWAWAAHKIDRFCCWALLATCLGGSALLDLHDLIGH